MRKNWTYDPPITRRTVVDEYGAGPPEKACGSDRGVLRRGGKRDFSPYLNRGLGESHSTQYAVRSTREKFVDPTLVDTKAGKSVIHHIDDRLIPFIYKVGGRSGKLA